MDARAMTTWEEKVLVKEVCEVMLRGAVEVRPGC